MTRERWRLSSLLVAGARRDAGSASILVLAIGLLVVAMGLAGTLLGAALKTGERIRVAADHGALAGATRVVEGAGVACARAAELAEANGADLTACRVAGDEIEVEVRAAVTLAGLTFPVGATARAGPLPTG